MTSATCADLLQTDFVGLRRGQPVTGLHSGHVGPPGASARHAGVGRGCLLGAGCPHQTLGGRHMPPRRRHGRSAGEHYAGT